MKPKAVLILSGKGGVGKTLVSINLVLHLKDKGVKAGLLDADFSASNSGYFLDLHGQHISMKDERFYPINYAGIEIFSIPLLLGENSVSMNGDQYGQLIRDAVDSAVWTSEYIIVDCPAGYGDEIKTAAQVFSDSLLGSIIVVQPAHELDGRRALQLHKDLEMPILGLIENMTYFQSGAVKYPIFGESIVDKLGEEYHVPVLGKIPLSMDIRKNVEEKNPKLEGAYAEPILKATEIIMNAKPVKPGFLERLKSLLREAVEKLMIELALSINKEINIPDIQQKFGYPGGAIIRLRIMDEKMKDEIAVSDWRVSQGKLVTVEGWEDKKPDTMIDVTSKAVKWALLHERVMSNGQTYTFKDALRLGHMRLYGDRSMARGAYFMEYVFTEISQNKNAMNILKPFLELL